MTKSIWNMRNHLFVIQDHHTLWGFNCAMWKPHTISNFLEIRENQHTFYGLWNLVLEVLKSYPPFPIPLIQKHSYLYGKTDLFIETSDVERPTWSGEERCRQLACQAEQPRQPEGQCGSRCLCQMAPILTNMFLFIQFKLLFFGKINKKQEHKCFMFLWLGFINNSVRYNS